ncbi:putative protein FAR-RED-ELONGATED HYPOCOTYL 1-LIKE-like [Cocos nucifera]|uniref:Uncharacterized protein n=1 Tax=Cocos nucifera TaxID=13894 RepID=A0A8K0NEV2_COCNU|nr:putative protein FAR-RED-ELONGATED HYPOCOTYL 1-LIKE-like [Cocos nucifera]
MLSIIIRMQNDLFLSYFSVQSTEELSRSRVELNKKRKLRYELDDLGLPLPKHKFRDRFNTSGRGSPTEESPKRVENLLKEISIEIRDGLEQPEDSDNDGNSFVEDCDQTEGYVTAMALDIDAGSGKPFGKILIQDCWPSTCSNSFDSNILKSSVDFLRMRNMIETDNREQAEGDVQQFDVRYQTMEQRGPPECETYGDHRFPEFGKNATEHLDAATKDDMLYSNDVAPNAFVLSSGSWSTGHDARLGARKPTIDQEFEQYFSMLML